MVVAAANESLPARGAWIEMQIPPAYRNCKRCSTCSELYIYDSIFFHCADDISDCNWVASCALLLFVWNSSIINLGKREFYTDFDNMSIQVAVENRLGRKVLFPAKFLGILEPEK